MKILVKIPLSPYSGYGNDGIGLTRALIRSGHDVYLHPTLVQSPLPSEVAELLTKSLEPPFDLTIVHVDPMAIKASTEERQFSEMVVGWTMWEYSNFKNMEGRSSLTKRLKDFDALIAYDEVTKLALEGYTKKPVVILQGGFEPDEFPEVERDWFSDRFGFCMVGALSERKDPFVAISAFQQLKADYPEEFEPAELHLKTITPGLHSQMEDWIPKLRIHYATWPTDVLLQFYSKQHVLLAPSRGEGKNMPALEFQSSGGTVIATNWGGHQQWLNNDYNYALDYVLRPASEKYPGTLNARASIDHLKEIMLHVFRNRAEAKRKGELAARVIPAMCSWDAVVDKLFLRLKDVPGGDMLYTKSRSLGGV